MDKIISNNIVELAELLVNKKFTYKNETFICLNVKTQQGRTIIFTDKRTLALYLSELQLIEVMEEISDKEIYKRTRKINNRSIILSEKNLEAKKKVAGNITGKNIENTGGAVVFVQSERGPQKQPIIIVSPKKEIIEKLKVKRKTPAHRDKKNKETCFKVVESTVDKTPFDPHAYKNHWNSPFKQEDNLWLIENSKNFTIPQIAEKFNVNYPTTYQHVKRNLRLDTKTVTDKASERQKLNKTKFTEEETLWIKNNGAKHTIGEIAERFKVSYANTYNYVVLVLKIQTMSKPRAKKTKIETKILCKTIPKTKSTYDKIVSEFVNKKELEYNPEGLKLGDFVYFKNIKDEGIVVGPVGKFFTQVQIVIPKKYARGSIVQYSTKGLKKIEKLTI